MGIKFHVVLCAWRQNNLRTAPQGLPFIHLSEVKSLEMTTRILTITVLEFPPSESCRSLVSLEFRYGMCVLLPSTSAEMTLPSVESDRLILVASFNLCPVAPVLDCLSEP